MHEPALPDSSDAEQPSGWRARAAHFGGRASRQLAILRMRFAQAVLIPDLSGEAGQQLRAQVREEGALTSGYILMCALSAGIATLGLLQSSTAVVIGAMLVSPLMSPIAALGFAFSSLDGHRIRDALRVVLIGAAIGIATGMLLTWLSPIRNATPEIIARTEPTLLDLAVALLSGIAGGYATVQQKGGTAIGVAIATALMPPLATLGYGLAVFEPAFAGGALLLFLTNLSAIAFSFALIARLSGAARPRNRVEWTPKYMAITVAAVLALGTPLAMTLVKVSNEAQLRAIARDVIRSTIGVNDSRIAQLDVTKPLLGMPTVDAVVISGDYRTGAEAAATRAITDRFGADVAVNLQQVLATDLPAQTRAMVDAAMERTAAGIAADVPPYDRIQSAIGLPVQAIWNNRAARVVNVVPVTAPDWTLADYRAAETAAQEQAGEWRVRVSPPPVPSLRIGVPPGVLAADQVAPELALWALQRWGVKSVRITAAQQPGEDETRDVATRLATFLAQNGVATARAAEVETLPVPRGSADDSPPASAIIISIYPERPTARQTPSLP